MTVKNYIYGTHRTIHPEETLARIQTIAKSMGITRTANLTGLDEIGIPTVAVYRPNSRSLSVSLGKGLTLLEAKASGLMESIEGYHAENILSPIKYCAYEDIKYTHAIAQPGELAKIRKSLYSDNKRICWIESIDIINETSVWIPLELVHTDFSLPPISGSGCFFASSNGLASGNTYTEAICHAICEVIERDQLACWLYETENSRTKSCLDISTISDVRCVNVLEKLQSAGIETAVYCISSDIDLPAFYCIIKDRNFNLSTIGYPSAGMGCHPNKEIALLRAITEAAQSRLAIISGARDDLDERDYYIKRSNLIPDITASISGGLDQYMNFGDIKSYEHDTVEDDLELLFRQLNSININSIYTVSLTRQEYDIPVVKVVVPKLEGYCLSDYYQPGERIAERLAQQT